MKDLGVPLMGIAATCSSGSTRGSMRIGKAPPEDLKEEEDVSFTISFPAGAAARIVVDPLDPMYYFAGGITTPNKKKGEGEGEGAGANPGGSPGGAGAEGEGGEEDDGVGRGEVRSRGCFVPAAGDVGH
jgi:hypothetical protein